MKILYAAAESSPFIKTGGLADVAGSLPLALKAVGHDVRVVIPLYSKIKDEYKDKMKKILDFTVSIGWREQYAGILEYDYEGVIYYFIDNEYYFNRNDLYGEFDDGERFIFFSKAISLMLRKLDFKPNVVNSNDWHTGLVPLYIKDFSKGDGFYSEIKTVHTIHNLKYQGVFPSVILSEIAGLDPNEYYHEDGLKFYNNINMMKAGIVYCDALTTVSNSYAEEIKYAYFGEQLEGIIKKHEYKLKGIINGIDYNIFNPKIDKHLKVNYDIKTLNKKPDNKLELQKLYNLPMNKDIPVIAMVTRLVAMKGLDLVRHIFEELIQEDIQFIVLGTGDKEYEDSFNYFQYKYPDKVASRIYFNETEAHLIYGGADMFLMPSLVEPCGISQLIALKYGNVPIVRETGGLRDTIIDYHEHPEISNGFKVKNQNAHELLFKLKEAISIYYDKKQWKELQVRGMKSKHDWEESSKEYTDLYSNLIS